MLGKINLLNVLKIFVLLFMISCTQKKLPAPVLHPFLMRLNHTLSPQTSGVSYTNTLSEISVQSLKIPLRGIALEGAAGTLRSDIYKCSGASGEECLIDLVNAEALKDILNSGFVNLKNGTYDTIAVYHCLAEGGFLSHVTAEVTNVGTNTTYRTQTSGMVSASAASAEAMGVQTTGCIHRHSLPTPISVKENDTVNLFMYFDPRYMVRMGFTSQDLGWQTSGCSGDLDFNGSVDGPFVCLATMDLTGVQRQITPQTESYLINNLGILEIVFDENSNPLGGFFRTYFNPALTLGSTIKTDVALKSVTVNGDGTLNISSFGSLTDTSAPSFFSVTSLRRTAVNDLQSGGTFVDDAGASLNFTAFRRD